MSFHRSIILKWAAAGALALGALGAASTANARSDVSWSVGINTPGIAFGVAAPTYYAPAATYYTPPPVYYAPPPVYYRPAPRAYYAPAPIYYAPPRPGYYGPRPHYRGHGYGHGHGGNWR